MNATVVPGEGPGARTKRKGDGTIFKKGGGNKLEKRFDDGNIHSVAKTKIENCTF